MTERKGETESYCMGDKVIYKGEEWEVGFVNQINFRGTLRLQKSGLADARQVNYIYPEDVLRVVRDRGGVI